MEPTDIRDILIRYDRLVIAGHIKPDGDSIGATLALGLILTKMGKDVAVLLGEFPDKYKSLPGQHLIYKGDLDDLNPDVFIAVDCGSLDRLGKAERLFNRCSITFNIDHHITNTQFAGVNLVYPKASSASEVMFNIITCFSELDTDIASLLYAGIVSDTNGFKNKSTTPSTHESAAKLMKFNIPFTEIYDGIMTSRTLPNAKMLAVALGKLSVKDGVAYSSITREEMRQCGATDLDTEGIIENLLSIDTAEVALFLYEKDMDAVKASIRSKNINVNEIAVKFGGGGHALAAGASFDVSADEALEILLEEFKEALTKSE